jgi:hypothetical protein
MTSPDGNIYMLIWWHYIHTWHLFHLMGVLGEESKTRMELSADTFISIYNKRGEKSYDG